MALEWKKTKRKLFFKLTLKQTREFWSSYGSSEKKTSHSKPKSSCNCCKCPLYSGDIVMKIHKKILTHYLSCPSPVDKEGYLYKKVWIFLH